jgi:pyruvate formate lyase activating enzyme
LPSKTLYKALPQNKVKCLACRNYCQINEGMTGICGVRQNCSGELKLLVYGKASAIAVDPIEKKPLYHFLPGSGIFSFGTIGCNFNCAFCQNWDLSQAGKNERRHALKAQIKPEELAKSIMGYGSDLKPKEIIAYCKKNNIGSIAYTYNEPSIFFEYSYDTAKLAKKQGIKNVYVTNGYLSREALKKIAPYLDAANIDLKSFNPQFYRDIVKANLAEVLESINAFYESGIHIELTTLLIPGKNDSPKELKQIAEFIAAISKEIPWHISRFTPQYKMQDIKSTSHEKLKQAYEIGKEAGLSFVYIGNINDPTLQSTYCPKCSEILIERDWGYVNILNLIKGKCGNCGFKIKGIWK